MILQYHLYFLHFLGSQVDIFDAQDGLMMAKAYYEFGKDLADMTDDKFKWVNDLTCKKIGWGSWLAGIGSFFCYLAMIIVVLLGFFVKYNAFVMFHLTTIAHEAIDIYKEDFDKIMYYDHVKVREWNYDSLSTINLNVGRGHQQMHNQLAQQHEIMTNTLGDYMECSTNHLGIQTLQGK